MAATFIVRWRNTEFSDRPITISDINSATIQDLKREIEQKFGISASTMKLMGPCLKLKKTGKPAHDDSTLLGDLRLEASNRVMVMGAEQSSKDDNRQPQQQQQQPPAAPAVTVEQPQQPRQLRDIENTVPTVPGVDPRIQAISQNVDKLEQQMRALQQQGNDSPLEKIVFQIDTIAELLMRELLGLDGLMAPLPSFSLEEFRAQRKSQVQRIQTLHDELDEMRGNLTQ